MKLSGSKLENDYRVELIRSNEELNLPESRLGTILRRNGYTTMNAYILHWIPDQGEDFYTLLIDGEIIVTTEIDRLDNTMVSTVDRVDLKEYLGSSEKLVGKNIADS